MPAWLSGSTFWKVLILPHQVWALLSLHFILFALLARLPRPEVAESRGGEASVAT